LKTKINTHARVNNMYTIVQMMIDKEIINVSL